ncbi:MAG: hypothetical protein OEZ10_01770 [Gammaproteobacteria bacterium]|nr:hypothetical protein [Gammaproteobacteria bacterium]
MEIPFKNLFSRFKKKSASSNAEYTVAMPNFDDGDLDAPSEEMLDIGGDSTVGNTAVDKPKKRGLFGLGGGDKKPKPVTRKNSGQNKRAALLLLLLVALGGGYFALNGGLALDIAPILEMVGLGEPAPTSQPAPAPRKRAAAPEVKTAAPATTNNADARPGSLVSKLDGKTFDPDFIGYEKGIVTLRQGPAGSSHTEIIIDFGHDNWEVPVGKSFDRATLVVRNNTPGSGGTEVSRNANTAVAIKFGDLNGESLAVAMAVNAGPVEIKGGFKAITTGFRKIGGQPVLTGDADETLMYVALKYMLAKEPGKSISKVAYSDVRFTPGHRPGKGELLMQYLTGGKMVNRHFEFSKNVSGWQVSQMKAEN